MCLLRANVQGVKIRSVWTRRICERSEPLWTTLLVHPNVRSTIDRFGNTTNSLACTERHTVCRFQSKPPKPTRASGREHTGCRRKQSPSFGIAGSGRRRQSALPLSPANALHARPRPTPSPLCRRLGVTCDQWFVCRRRNTPFASFGGTYRLAVDDTPRCTRSNDFGCADITQA